MSTDAVGRVLVTINPAQLRGEFTIYRAKQDKFFWKNLNLTNLRLDLQIRNIILITYLLAMSGTYFFLVFNCSYLFWWACGEARTCFLVLKGIPQRLKNSSRQVRSLQQGKSRIWTLRRRPEQTKWTRFQFGRFSRFHIRYCGREGKDVAFTTTLIEWSEYKPHPGHVAAYSTGRIFKPNSKLRTSRSAD